MATRRDTAARPARQAKSADDDRTEQWGLDATGNWSTFTKLPEGTPTLSQTRLQSPASPNGVDHYEHVYYAGEQVVETRETDTVAAEPESLQPKYQWVWSPRYIDAPVLRDENTDQDGLCDDTPRLYFLTDANMNVTTLVDTAGDALERYTYTPYGVVTFRNPGWSLRKPRRLSI